MSSVAGFVIFVVLAFMLAASVVLGRAARRSLQEDLGAAERVFVENWSYRRSVLRSEARVVAEEPRLKAVTAAEEVSRETLVGVVQEIATAIGADLFVLTDASGGLLVDLADPEHAGQDLRGQTAVELALSSGEASGVWTTGQHVYQVQAVRIDFGDTPFGVLVLGYLVETALLDAIDRQAGARALLELDGRVTSTSSQAAELDPSAASGAIAALPTGAVGAEIVLGGERYLALAGRIPDYTGSRQLRFVLLRSLDEALAPAARLRNILGLIAIMGLGLAFVGAWRLGSSLSRPVERLVELSRQLGAGQLSARVTPEGPRETRALASAIHRMAEELGSARESLKNRDRMQRELEIAERIQTAILPRDPQVPGLEVAARMQPASEVGGDYYDIHPTPEGAWIGIGDVAGHGLTAGLIMLMIQSSVASLVRALPTTIPSNVITYLNQLVYLNVKERLGELEHATFVLLRYDETGRVTYAGAHEDLIVYRQRTRQCELIPTKGMWLGPVRDIGGMLPDRNLELEPGDLLVLYTDGIVEAMNAAQQVYDVERLCDQIRKAADAPVSDICDRIFDDVAAYSPVLDDDRTLIVLRQMATPAALRPDVGASDAPGGAAPAAHRP